MSSVVTLFLTLVVVIACNSLAISQDKPSWGRKSGLTLEEELVGKYGEGERARLQRGIKQVLSLWRESDGDAGVFEEFVRTHFAGDKATRDTLFARSELLMESLRGHMNKMVLDFRWQVDVEKGPILPFDEMFAAYDPSAHISDDFFENKIAFVILLNFPLTTLEQRLTEGAKWTRQEWAEARLASGFDTRIPADVNLAVSTANAASEQYIAQYNIWMHHLLTDKGERLFPEKLRLLSHWNLRDEIKANYSLEDKSKAIAKQRMIQRVMERIVDQTIPADVVNNPFVDWKPYANEVKASTVKDHELPAPAKTAWSNAPEPDTRYTMLLNNFLAARKVDPYSPAAPTLIARKFNDERELPEERVASMLKQILSSPLVPRVAALIEKRLGRPLEPFDIWYNGFKARGAYTEEMLDSITSRKYPTPDAFSRDIPNILMKLGFAPPLAEYLASNISVDPARGSGHAWGPQMRSEKAHLRTRVEKSGMNYKGYNIAVHELGHNVEQILSMKNIDYALLNGVPNTAFTEALAFVFQGKDMELLGLTKPDAQSEALATLNDFWATFEIGGVGLVDMGVWHWMYDHPNATPAELKKATLDIAKNIWNQYYAPVFKKKDVVLLGIYSHMINSQLYLPDYPIGHLIAHQIEEQMKKAGSIGPEFERSVKMGSLTPDFWMKNATGAPVGAEAMLAETERALKVVK